MTSVPTTKAIRAEYRGIKFRSRTEARWAVFLDEMGIRWQYEAEGYELPSGWYLPDFWLPDMLWFFEVKPDREQGTQKAQELSQTVMRNVAITNGPPDVSSGIGFRAMVVDPVNHLFADVKGDVIPWRMSRDQPWRFVKTEFAVLSGELGCFLEIALALAKAQNFSFWEPESETPEPRLKMRQPESLPATTQPDPTPKRSGPSLRDRVRSAQGLSIEQLVERWDNIRLDMIALRPKTMAEEKASDLVCGIVPIRVNHLSEGKCAVVLVHPFSEIPDNSEAIARVRDAFKGVIERQTGQPISAVSLTYSSEALASEAAS